MRPTARQSAAPFQKEGAKPSAAFLTYQRIHDKPYRYTSDEIIFGVYAERNGIPEAGRAAAQAEFFSKGQACLRSSDLCKKYGWGVHSDAAGRVALYGVETREYKELASGKKLGSSGKPMTVKAAMRTKRGPARTYKVE